MKSIGILTVWLIIMCTFSNLSAQDKNFKGYRFFINPGHGGKDLDDRYFAATDFWESEGNLEKGLYLKYLLEKEKATVFISRYSNTSSDDLDFAVIDEMANAANVDFFLSIHSNAGSTKVNRPLMLFRGYDFKPVFGVAREMAEIMWQKVFENGNCWTISEPYVKGDWNFYKDWGKQGLGVLRTLTMPAVLSEGSFHDYQPESWRLKNLDFLHHEAHSLFRAFNTFYGIKKEHKGIATGIIRDSGRKSTSKFTVNTPDAFMPVNKAIVKLMPGERFYETDSLKNGFYYFDNIEPGEYKLVVEGPNGVGKDSASITVWSDYSTITDFKLKLR